MIDRIWFVQIGANLRVCTGVLFASALSIISCPSVAQAPASRDKAADWAKIVAAAKQEGRVMLYSTALPAVNERLAEDLAKAYPGIKMEVVRLSGFALTSKVDQERIIGVDGADVLIMNDMLWLTNAIKSGWVLGPVGPSVTEWPARYLIGGKSPTAAAEPYAIVYNTAIVKTPITGYLDILKLDPNYKIGVYDLISRGTVAWYDWLADNFGNDYLKTLAAKKLSFYSSASSSTQSTASGEIAINLATNPSATLPLVQQGAPIKMVIPKRAMGSFYNFVALNWSKRPNAALVAMDYVMSRRGQTVWSGSGTSASPLPNIPGSLTADGIDSWDATKYTDEVAKVKTAQWDALFKGK